MTRRFLIAILAAALASPLAAQPATSNATTSEPRPIADADDPVNRLVEQTTVDGLLVELRIDGAAVSLESAQPARIPRRNERRDLAGDTITVTALAGGVPAGSATVPDELVNVQEGVGLVRQERRSIIAAVPTQGAVEFDRGPGQRVGGDPAVRRDGRLCGAVPRLQGSALLPGPAAGRPSIG